MARTTQQIQDEIINNVQADATLNDKLTSTSGAAIWRLWTYVFAFCINTVETLWDAFKAEILDLLSRLFPHTLRWYAEKAKAFQYGFPLLQDSDQFDNTGYTTAQIEASKVIKYVAVTEEEPPGGRQYLRMKLAGTDGTDLTPLANDVLIAIRAYFKKVKDAGVKMVIQSLSPDKTKQKWIIYYDATILTSTGARTDGTASQPVKDAIKDYLKNLPFNGLYVRALHIDAVQKISGVVIPDQVECQATYGLLPFNTVAVEYQPDAGWMRFINDADLEIEYIPHDAIEQ